MNRIGGRRTAVVLFNLGGPDSLDAVRPFLFNLFFDPAIIGAPLPVRWALAKYISGKRAPVARGIYDRLGGRSPLLPETETQARALEHVLGKGFRCFIAMRYWHPFTAETVQAVKEWGADEVVLLPLYPQFSTTTTGSSFKEWHRQAKRIGLEVPTRAACCWPTERGLIAALGDLTRRGWEEARDFGMPRVLFSAHGLPKSVIAKGDPYQAQVEMTAAAAARATGIEGLDWVVCYQSRVGPLEWIGPATEEELERAARDGVPVVVVPVAFVSEHSETLVELDIEYREKADHLGVPGYVRVPAPGRHPDFIAGLAEVVRAPEAFFGKACQTLGRRCGSC